MENIQYTTKEDIENYILKNIDDGFDGQLGEWIKAMSNYIENTTKRRIYRQTEETFKYDGDGSDLMIISDCNNISEVKLDGNVLTKDVDYTTYPKNKSYSSRIVLLGGLRFTRGVNNLEITAIQSMTNSLPSDINFACTVLVAGILNSQMNNDKKGTTERIGNYSITYKDDQQIKDFEQVKSILAGYTRIVF